MNVKFTLILAKIGSIVHSSAGSKTPLTFKRFKLGKFALTHEAKCIPRMRLGVVSGLPLARR